MDTRWSVLILFVLAMAAPAMAVQPISLSVTNCGISNIQPSATCGDTVTFTCQVLDTASTQGLNQLSFIINGETKNGVLQSGTVKNGTWEYEYVVNDQTGSNLTLDSITAINAAGVSCSGSLRVDSDSCFINFTEDRTIETACTCAYTVSSVCAATNLATVQHTPGSGCTSGSAYTTTAVCDYCDPEWRAQYATCITDRNSSTPFVGTSLKTYTSGNPSCCLQTGLASDCQAPVDNGVQSQCRLDYWTSAGKNTEGTSQNLEVVQAHADTVTYSKVGVWSQGVGTNALRPLVFDADNDGRSEAVVFTEAGFQLYTELLGTAESTVLTSHDYWQGQPGMFGFNNYGMTGYVWDIDVQDETYGIGVAGIMYDVGAGKDYFVSYRYESGSWVLKQNIDLEATFGGAGNSAYTAGVSCWLNDCYFLNDANKLIKINALTGSSSTVTLAAVVSPGTPIDAVPVFGGFGSTPQFVAVEARKQVGPDFIAALYVCNLALSSCTSVNSAAEIGDMSRLAVGPSPTANRARVYYAYNFTDTGNATHAYIAVAEVDATLAVAIQDATELTPFADDSVSVCVSDVAAARCAAGQHGVAVAAGFTGVSGASSPVELEFDYTATDEVSSPLSAVNIGSSSAVGKTICTGTRCFMLSGVDGYTPGVLPTIYNWADMVLYQSDEAGAWQPKTMSADFMSFNFSSCPGGKQISDGVVGLGAVGGDLYVLRTNLTAYKGATVYRNNQSIPIACVSATGDTLTRWQGLYVDKYDAGTETWSTIYGNESINMTEASTGFGKYLVCDDDRCWQQFQRNVAGTSYFIFEITSGDQVTYDVPQGTVGGLVMDQHLVIGYAKTSSARYFATAGSSTATASKYIVRYTNAAPTTPILLETLNNRLVPLGLKADDSVTDRVYYSVIPTTDAPNCVQVRNATVGSVPVFDSGIETVDMDTLNTYSSAYWSGCGGFPPPTWGDVRAWKSTCTYEIKRSTSGGAPTVYDQNTVVRWGGGYYGSICGGGTPTGMVLGPSHTWSIGAFDDVGEYYSAYDNALCLPQYVAGGGGLGASCLSSASSGYPNPSASSAIVLEVNAKDGAYHPYKMVVANSSNVNGRFFNEYGNTCDERDMVGDPNSAQCLPAILDNAGIQIVPKNSYAGGLDELKYGPVAPPSNIIRTMTTGTQELVLDRIGTASSQVGDYSEYACLVYAAGAGFTKVFSKTESGYSCELSLASTDINNDGIDEIVAPSGVYSAGVKEKTFIPAAASSSVITVDISSDTFADFLVITPTVLRAILSNPQIAASYAENLTMSNLVCVFNDESNAIEATGVGIGAQNPTSLSFQGTARTTSGAVVSSATSTSTPTVELPVSLPGDYTVTYTVRDQITQESATRTCTVTAPTSAFPADVGVAVSACTLSPDGDFNYLDPQGVTNYDWVTDTNAHEPIMKRSVQGELYANFQVSETNILHGLSCENDQLTMIVRAKMDSSSNTKILLEGEDQYGTSNTIGGIWLYQGQVFLFSSTGDTQVLNTIDSDWHIYKLVFDESSQQYQLYLDDVEIGAVGFVNDMTGDYSAVSVRHLAGITDVDYITVEGTGAIRKAYTDAQKNILAARAYLDTCEASSERNFDENPPGYMGGVNASDFYPHVDAYCQKLSESRTDAYCSFDELSKAVKYNGDCYKEAFDYCISMTYPQSAGFDDSRPADDPFPNQQKTLDGAAACNLALGLSVGTERIVAPSYRALMVVFKENWGLGIVLLVLIFIIIGSANRRQ